MGDRRSTAPHLNFLWPESYSSTSDSSVHYHLCKASLRFAYSYPGWKYRIGNLATEDKWSIIYKEIQKNIWTTPTERTRREPRHDSSFVFFAIDGSDGADAWSDEHGAQSREREQTSPEKEAADFVLPGGDPGEVRPLQTSVTEGLLAVSRRNHHRSLQIPPQTARQAERKLPLSVLWKVREIGARGMLPRGSAHRALCLLTPPPLLFPQRRVQRSNSVW